MAYAADRVSTVKLEASPSLAHGNLAAAAHKLAFAHKDSVYTMDIRAIDGKVPATLEKVPLREPLHGVMQVAWSIVAGAPLLVVATRGGFSIWSSEGTRQLFSSALQHMGISTEDALFHYCRGIATLPTTDTICIGTSWGDVLTASVAGEAVSLGAPMRFHKAAISCSASDDRTLVSADDAGVVAVWDIATMSVRFSYAATEHPCTGVAVRGNCAIATFANGLIRIYRVFPVGGATPAFPEVEIAAHSRCITGLDLHPTQYTFVTVGADSVVNVWSLPEMQSADKCKPTLDMTARIPDAYLTGVQFARHAGKGAVPHIAITTYDQHVLRVFLGL